jgi:predicted nucleic acid-binding protein
VIVVDTTVIAHLFLDGDHVEEAKHLLTKEAEWAAPRLWRSEFRNVLTKYYRHQRLDENSMVALMDAASARLAGREFDPSNDKVFDCVLRSNLSAYDAEFVALAIDLKTYLITADRQIVREFPDTAIDLRDFT